jgi:hypothetical protein
MKLIDLPFFVELGARLEEASTIDPQARLFDAYFKVFPLRQTLERLSSGEHVQLSATTHDLTALQTAIDRFFRRHFQDEQGNWRSPPEEARSQFELSSLVSSITQFRTVLIADLRTVASFRIIGAGIFDVNLLVNCAHKALPESTRSNLPVEALEELDAAGKCLAFNLPTASGFHAMRAVERVMRTYLGHFFSQEEIKRWTNWGRYIQALEKAAATDKSPKPSKEAIALLGQLKDIYRNPVIHPDRVLSPEEADTLFHGTLAAINRIGFELSGSEEKLPGLGLLGLLRQNSLGAGAAALLGKEVA